MGGRTFLSLSSITLDTAVRIADSDGLVGASTDGAVEVGGVELELGSIAIDLKLSVYPWQILAD